MPLIDRHLAACDGIPHLYIVVPAGKGKVLSIGRYLPCPTRSGIRELQDGVPVEDIPYLHLTSVCSEDMSTFKLLPCSTRSRFCEIQDRLSIGSVPYLYFTPIGIHDT